MSSGVILSDASRYRVNHDLAPFDIQVGRDPQVSGRAQDIVEVRREEVVKSVLCMMSSLAKMTKFPLGDHFAVET